MADDDNKKAENEPPLEQASFEINDADSEVAHNAIRDAVKDLNGVREGELCGRRRDRDVQSDRHHQRRNRHRDRRSGYRAPEITSSPGDVEAKRGV